jgi:hypothetical protein
VDTMKNDGSLVKLQVQPWNNLQRCLALSLTPASPVLNVTSYGCPSLLPVASSANHIVAQAYFILDSEDAVFFQTSQRSTLANGRVTAFSSTARHANG